MADLGGGAAACSKAAPSLHRSNHGVATMVVMKAAVTPVTHFQAAHLLAVVAGMLPAIALGTSSMLDQSMRRPSLVRVAVQALHMAF